MFLMTGMLARREVVFVQPTKGRQPGDAAPIRVTAKRELGFHPEAYHERTVPVPGGLVELLQARGERLELHGVGLIFGTSPRALGASGQQGRQGRLQAAGEAEAGGQAGGPELRPLPRPGATAQAGEVLRGGARSAGTWGLHKFRHTYCHDDAA